MSYRQRIMPWLNWGITTSFALFQFLLQAASGLMASDWQAEFKLSTTEVGYLSSAFYIAYVVMQIPVGLAYDRFGARRILCMAAILLCVGIFGLGLSQCYWQGFLARILMGMGSAFGFVGMLYVTSAWFSGKHFAILVGISETIAMFGVAFGEIGMAWIIEHYGWRMMMFLAGSWMLLTSLFIFIFIQDSARSLSRPDEVRLSFSDSIKKVITHKQIWLAGLYGFTMFAIVNVFVTLWGVPFYTQTHGYSLNTAGTMMSMVFVGTATGAPVNGWIIGRWKIRQTIMTIFAAATALLFACILYIPELSFKSILCLLFLTGFFSSSYIQVFAIIRDEVDIKLRATALASTNMILMASAPILQPLVGKALELKYSFTQALSIIEVGLVLAVILSLGLDKKKQDKLVR